MRCSAVLLMFFYFYFYFYFFFYFFFFFWSINCSAVEPNLSSAQISLLSI